ncbi:Hypothetical predicted protein [Scomber scombrus]|uniref:Uncharacterized protein n=1 Tax=Scomber scombrus TaxID=13677 RepID=A0AAV1Q6Y1_SCOSC
MGGTAQDFNQSAVAGMQDQSSEAGRLAGEPVEPGKLEAVETQSQDTTAAQELVTAAAQEQAIGISGGSIEWRLYGAGPLREPVMLGATGTMPPFGDLMVQGMQDQDR